MPSAHAQKVSRSYSSIRGKVFAVSGAASGVGLETAKILYGMGARISITDNRKDALDASVTEITHANRNYKINVLSTVIDVRSSGEVKRWIQRTISHFSGLDGAANVAGVLGPSVGIQDLSEFSTEEWDLITNVNQKGMFYALKEEIRGMDSLGTAGSIVNVSSVAGIEGNSKNACYSASKHAVIGLTRSVAKEVGKRGIRVNAVAP
jgi:NAD(P)-dependent dehydrogenase (short-subunit alcohol dehydrogenase family)